ncbi:alpha-amylase [Lactococcus lactis]|uniref:alpha-amylase n=1 Tax=Lactococcus lactis TaxID=1358 RepID=UPI0020264BDC|nr:alpha-amylase [Lactococcus lactis]MCL9638732.1 alpha-amylase [Lactococcus lactis]
MKTILQAFEWYLPSDSQHWNNIKENIPDLGKLGFSGLWLPPAFKAASGVEDVGYGTYDLFDLGEFDQKGTIPTKYGTKDEYLDLINTLHHNNIEVYADIVFNHMMGADETETIEADIKAEDNHLHNIENNKTVEVWTKFTFPGRQGKYDNYIWTWHNFTGIDYDERKNQEEILEFEGHEWDENVDSENNNFDYLMGADLDFSVSETVEQLEKWGHWFSEMTKIDGFRLDAIKHIDFKYFDKWLEQRAKQLDKKLFIVGEYWSDDLGKLEYYLEQSGDRIQLFDVPLHFNMKEASSTNGEFDMRTLFDHTLTASQPELSVTFVDNHDTQEGQALQSWIPAWFKEHAYSLILLRKKGTPTVFWGDLYGIPSHNVNPVGDNLRTMIALRKDSEFLREKDYFDHPDIIGWTNILKIDNKEYGLSCILTNKNGGSKYMIIDKAYAGKVYIDLFGRHEIPITLDQNGGAEFYVNDGSVSVWVDKEIVSKIDQMNFQN